MTTTPPPVVATLNVEGFGHHDTATVEITRDEWDTLTPAQRVALLDEMAGEHAAFSVGWGWHIDDPTDLAATEGARP